MDAHKNFAYSTVATAPSPATSGTSLVVASGDGSKFPAVPFNATVWPTGVQPTVANAEIVRVTNISTDTLTITRSQESTSARTVVVGDQIANTITAKVIKDVEDGIPVKATAAELAAGTDDDKYATALGLVPFTNNSMFRQAIINGNFDVWQRGTSFTTSYGYTADRFLFARNGAGTTTTTRDTDVPNSLSTYSFKTSGAYGVGELQDIKYRVEAANAAKFSGKQVTFSFWHKESVTAGTSTFNVLIDYASAADNFTTVGGAFASDATITNSATWVQSTVTVTLPATSNTGGYSIANGFEIILRHTQSANTGTLTSYKDQLELNLGSVALPFMPKSFNQELIDCQRYFEKSFNYGTTPADGDSTAYLQFPAGAYSSTIARGYVFFKTRKRIAPVSLTTYRDATGSAAGKWNYYNGSSWANSSATSLAQGTEIGFSIDVTGSYTQFSTYLIGGHWTVDVEL